MFDFGLSDHEYQSLAATVANIFRPKTYKMFTIDTVMYPVIRIAKTSDTQKPQVAKNLRHPKTLGTQKPWDPKNLKYPKSDVIRKTHVSKHGKISKVCTVRKSTFVTVDHNAHSLVWPKEEKSPVCGTRSTFVLSAEQAVSNSDSTRPGDKLSCRKPAGSATEQSLSAGYFLNPAILPDPAITGIPGRISRAPVRTRIKGKMDQARRGNAESGLLKGKPGAELGPKENNINHSLSFVEEPSLDIG